jgi:alkylation response protein AidB-like acyl-CoA dehydrogenase
MHFGLTSEQQLLQQTVRDFAAQQLPAPRLRELFDAGSGHDPALWRGLAGIGLTGLVAPERQGGAGLEILDLALAFEVLGAAALPAPLLGHSLACLAIARGGSEAQRERWLPALASGERIGALAIAEDPDAWEPSQWRTKRSNGSLTGAKTWVPGGGVADLFVVGAEGGELALVERGAAGVEVALLEGIDRTRPLARLELRGAPAEPLAQGAAEAEQVLDAGRVLLAADSFGAAWKLIETTADYTRTRRQFGTPLAQFQAVKHRLADMACEMEPTRGLWWYAAHALDHRPDEAPRAAAMAKAHVTDRAADAARAAVELHGGIGFTWECDVQFWVKRAMFNRAWLGTPEVQRERVARLGGW